MRRSLPREGADQLWSPPLRGPVTTTHVAKRRSAARRSNSTPLGIQSSGVGSDKLLAFTRCPLGAAARTNKSANLRKAGLPCPALKLVHRELLARVDAVRLQQRGAAQGACGRDPLLLPAQAVDGAAGGDRAGRQEGRGNAERGSPRCQRRRRRPAGQWCLISSRRTRALHCMHTAALVCATHLSCKYSTAQGLQIFLWPHGSNTAAEGQAGGRATGRRQAGRQQTAANSDRGELLKWVHAIKTTTAHTTLACSTD